MVCNFSLVYIHIIRVYNYNLEIEKYIHIGTNTTHSLKSDI